MFNKIFYLIKYFFLRKFIRKYKISLIPNYDFVFNDHIINFYNIYNSKFLGRSNNLIIINKK